MNFQKKKTHWNIKVIFTVGHLHVPYEWITLMPINTSDTSHNPEIYQVFHSDFQLIMSYTSFSLNSLHAGSISCFLELQVSDSGGGRYSIRRDSPPEKGCGIQRASTESCGWLCNKGQIQVILCCRELKWDVWECAWSLRCTYLNNSYEVWKKKSRQCI